MSDRKVSIIITAHNYARYLEPCLESALNQTYDNYEVVAVDDGSTDETPEILDRFQTNYPERLKTIRLEGEGLPAACNAGIREAEGEYIIRLDADDYFDENILTVEAEYLDSHPDVHLVYPDYYTIDKSGEIIDHVRNMRVGEEVKLLNRSPLAAGAVFRRSAWEESGGYSEELNYQEDYDFWIRFINEYTVRNVNLPLMYYRQHDNNMSDNLIGRLNARREVKRKFVDVNLEAELADMEILSIIPARAEERFQSPESASGDVRTPLALQEISGRPLIEYTVREALAADRPDRVMVSTDDEEIASLCRDLGAGVPYLRDPELAEREVLVSEVIEHTLEHLEEEEGYEPDFVVLQQYVAPLKTADVIDGVIDSWMMFSVDSVMTVAKNNKFLWQPGKFGLEPLHDERLLRERRETLYQENGAIYSFTPEVIFEYGEILGGNVGHVMMPHRRSIHIDSWFEWKMCDMILESSNGLRPDYRSDL